jgi:hypothetical protein
MMGIETKQTLGLYQNCATRHPSAGFPAAVSRPCSDDSAAEPLDRNAAMRKQVIGFQDSLPLHITLFPPFGWALASALG